jgi:hypothetical protein
VVGCAGLAGAELVAEAAGAEVEAAGAEVEAEAAGVLVVAWLWVRPTAARIIRAAAMIVPMTMAQMRYQDGPWLLGRGARWLVSGWLVAGRSSV